METSRLPFKYELQLLLMCVAMFLTTCLAAWNAYDIKMLRAEQNVVEYRIELLEKEGDDFSKHLADIQYRVKDLEK